MMQSLRWDGSQAARMDHVSEPSNQEAADLIAKITRASICGR